MGTHERSHPALRCMWIGPSKEAYERTQPAWGPFCLANWLPFDSLGGSRDIQEGEPGTIFVLEFAGTLPGEFEANAIDAWERAIRIVLDEANLPW